MLIDTHAHINFSDFKDDADETIHRALDNGTWMILVGSQYKTSKRALEYANKYDQGVYAAVGLHPIHLEDLDVKGEDYEFSSKAEEFNYDNYAKLTQFQKVVAIGEIGLDYYHIKLTDNLAEIKKKQQLVFIEQLKLARQYDLPVIIHCRQAHDDLLRILTEFRGEYRDSIGDQPWGVVHCFSGDEDLAWKYFNLGLLISFTGLITFSKQWDDLIRKAPLEKIMIETDSPYMTPEPFRGTRNEPALVNYVANRIAEIKNLKFDKVAEITFDNAKKLFNL
jgi:TatD DNase family protein